MQTFFLKKPFIANLTWYSHEEEDTDEAKRDEQLQHQDRVHLTDEGCKRRFSLNNIITSMN